MIIKTVIVQFDGRQHLVRIPTKISKLLNIQKGDLFLFEVEKRRKTQNFKIIKI